MLRDVRYALRMLALRPGTAAATVALLAIAIAGSVATFVWRTPSSGIRFRSAIPSGS